MWFEITVFANDILNFGSNVGFIVFNHAYLLRYLFLTTFKQHVSISIVGKYTVYSHGNMFILAQFLKLATDLTLDGGGAGGGFRKFSMVVRRPDY